MVAVFSRPVNYISDLGGRITTAWKHGAMRGSRQASACLEGVAGRVGFPATLASAKCIKTKNCQMEKLSLAFHAIQKI